MAYPGMPKARSHPVASSEGNYHKQKPGKPKEQPIASGIREDTGCIEKDRWGKPCGKPLALDSHAYCEECKVEVRRSV